MSGLDDILKEPEVHDNPEAPKAPAEPAKDKSPEAPASSARREHQAKEAAAQGRDPVTGQFVPKTPTEPTEPASAAPGAAPATPAAPTAPAAPAAPAAPEKPPAQPELTARERALLAATQDERNKRQAAERKLAELQAGKPQEEPKTFWDDPEGRLAAHEKTVKQAILSARLSTAEMIARHKHADYDEKIAAFKGILEQNPQMMQPWLASPDPAEYAYSLGKNHLDLQNAGSMDELKARIEKETRIKVEAELKAKAEQEAKLRASIPVSLSDAPSSGAVNRPTWGGPTPLDSILKP